MLSGKAHTHREIGKGVISDQGRAGQALAPGFNLIGVVWAINGDLEYLANSLGMEHTSSHKMCPWCRANDLEYGDAAAAERLLISPTPWNEIGQDAAWRSTVYQSAEEWFISHGGRHSVHPVLALPGVSGLTVIADAMHTLDLGIAHHICGNILFKFCWEGRYFPGAGAPQDRLDLFWGIVEHRYVARKVNCRIPELSLDHFTNTRRPHLTYPCLSTRIKAAATRHFVPVLASIFEDRCNAVVLEDHHMLRMLQGLVRAYSVLGSHVDAMLPAAAVAEFQSGIDQCPQHYRWLHVDAFRKGMRLWKEAPKIQFLQTHC